MDNEIFQFGEHERTELAAIIRNYRKNGPWGKGNTSPKPLHKSELLDELPSLKNTESDAIPPYACLEVTGAVDEFTPSRSYIQVKKPTSAGVHFLFNGKHEIEANGYGTAQRGEFLRVLKNTGTVTFGNRWRPTSGQWYLTKGIGNYIILGSDDIASNVLRVRFDPSVRFYRFSLKAAWSGTPKKASCDIYEMDGTDTTIDEDVYDYEEIFQDLTTGDTGYCVYQDNKLSAIQAPRACP